MMLMNQCVVVVAVAARGRETSVMQTCLHEGV